MKTKIISLICSFALILAILPVNAFAAAEAPAFDVPAIKLVATYDAINDQVSVEVKLDEVADIGSVGIKFSYDESKLTYTSCTNAILSSPTTNASAGIATYSWSDSNGSNLSSEATIATFVFSVIEGKTGSIPFSVEEYTMTDSMGDVEFIMDPNDSNTVPSGSILTATVTVPSQTYTLSFVAGDGTGSMDSATVNAGDEYTLPENGFTAPEGKQFKAWSVGGSEKAVGDKITVNADTTVTAVWEDIPVTTYTVSFAAGDGTGSMESATVNAGDEYTLPENGFTAPEGKQFKAWSVGGSEKAVGDKITVNADTTVTAVWEDIPVTTYTVSFAAGDGTGSMDSATVNAGDEYTLPANGFTAPEGKQFKAWSVGGSEKAVGDKIAVNADTTVTAVWEDIPVTTYTVSFAAGDGTGSMDSATVNAGEEYTLPENGFTAPEGKQFKAWSVGGSEKAVGDKITVNADTTVTAVWEDIPVTTCTVSFAAGDGTGSMDSATVNAGEEYTLPENGFTAPEGKQFKAWSVGGNEKSVGDKITVNADTTVTAVWENIPVTTYTVSFSAGDGTGSMDSAAVNAGDEYTLPANGFTAPEGKQFKAWSVGGSEKAVGDKITVNADTTVTAVWEDATVVSSYTITASAGNGGAISPNGTVSVEAGEDHTFTITASNGYVIKSVKVDGVNVGAVSTYTFTDIDANHTIQATFSKKSVPSGKVPYLISVYSETGGTIIPSTSQLVSSGSSITFSIQADEGYEIADVIVDGKSVGAVSTYTFKNVSSEHYISVKFKKIEVPVENIVVRYSGNDRIATAIEISKAGWSASDTVIIACSNNYPDALAGAALAKKLDAPILLSDSDKLNASVFAEINRLGAKKIIILGGTAAISQNIENDLSKLYSVERVAGENRNGTAAEIAYILCEKSDIAFLVSNMNYADALSISPVAALKNAPILYANPDGSIPAETAEAIEKLGCAKVYIIGGTAAIGSTAESNLYVPSERVFGNDRYLTSVEIVKKFADVFTSDDIAVATGKNFPDALAGAAFAAKNSIPVFLVDENIAAYAVNYIKSVDCNSIIVFGGENAVSEATVQNLVK